MSETKRYKSTIDKDAWKEGTRFDRQTQRVAPSFTFRKDAKQDRINRTYEGAKQESFKELAPYAERGGAETKTRNTWIQRHMRSVQWTPGPGAYRSYSTLPAAGPGKSNRDEVDAQIFKTRGRTGAYSIGKDIKDTTNGVGKESQAKANNHNYPRSEVLDTPGPGTYGKYTGFGSGQWRR